MSKKLANFLLKYGASLHDEDVKIKLAKMFDLKYGDKEEEPNDEEEEEEEEE